MAAATFLTASSKAGVAICPAVVTAPTLRTYCRAADSTSSVVAGGSSPRSGVMFRHMTTTIRLSALACLGRGYLSTERS